MCGPNISQCLTRCCLYYEFLPIPYTKFYSRVRFVTKHSIKTIVTNEAFITYNSGADGHYINEQDRIAAGLLILRKLTKRVGVANGGSSTAEHVTQLPIKQILTKANQSDTFVEFSHSLMSAGKAADDGPISMFAKGQRRSNSCQY